MGLDCAYVREKASEWVERVAIVVVLVLIFTLFRNPNCSCADIDGYSEFSDTSLQLSFFCISLQTVISVGVTSLHGRFNF